MSKKSFLIITFVFAMIGTAFAGSNGVALKSDDDKISYTIGADMGRNFKAQEIKINADALAAGLSDAMKGGKLQMSDKAMQDTLMSFQKQFQAKREARLKALADQNLKEGQAFLAKNKKRKGVTALPSGLQYRVITPGKGAHAKDSDTVTVNYAGRLINGEVFETTFNGGTPLTIQVSEVIPGWREALKLMRPGATWELYIPSGLAYGSDAVGQIGPNSTLVFKVNLLSIQDKKGAAGKKQAG